MNRIMLLGRLTKDPELRNTKSGLPVASFSLAVDRRTKNENGERETDFFNCTAWRTTAELIGKHLTKGRQVCVSGTLQMRSWTDNDGNKRTSPEVVVDEITFCGTKDDGGAAKSASAAPAAEKKPSKPAKPAAADDDDDDLPF